MVYPKHQGLSTSPSKKARMAISMAEFKTTTTDAHRDSANADVSLGTSNEARAFAVVAKMLASYNTMLTLNASLIEKIEETNAKSTAMLDAKFDSFLRHVKNLERHIDDIKARTDTNDDESGELG